MKLQIFGFAIIVAAAVAGVDYSMQSKTTNQSLGVTGYVDTITGRFHAANEARALKSRQKQEVKIHLPEAPEGWSRSEWAETDTTRLAPKAADLSGFQKRSLKAMELAPMMGGMVATEIQSAGRMQRSTIWVYERNDEIIALRVIYTKTGAAKRFPGLDTKIDKANIAAINRATPYAFVQGVGFGEVHVDRALTGPVNYRAFSASMGSNVMIAVRAEASDASIKAMIGAIDFDGLNGMLDAPLAQVGKQAPQVGQAQEMVLAEQAIEARRAVLRGEEPAVVGQTAEAQETRAVVETKAVVQVAPAKTIKVGFDRVSGLPGQKCDRKSGNVFCAVATE